MVGRVIQVTQPDGSTNASAYQGDGVSIVFTDPLGHSRIEVRNVLGELVTSTDSGGLSTQYEYDAIGNLTAVEPFRPIFIGAALVAMFFAYRRIFRPAQACKPGEVCSIPQVRTAYKIIFWIVAVLVVVALAFPYVLPLFY